MFNKHKFLFLLHMDGCLHLSGRQNSKNNPPITLCNLPVLDCAQSLCI